MLGTLAAALKPKVVAVPMGKCLGWLPVAAGCWQGHQRVESGDSKSTNLVELCFLGWLGYYRC